MADKALGVGAKCCGEGCGLAGCGEDQSTPPPAAAQSYALEVDLDELGYDEEDDR